jgi:hypothetical protein
MSSSLRRPRFLVALVAILLIAPACSTGPTGEDDRDAAVYAAVVRWLLTDEGGAPGFVPFGPDDDRPVFIEPIDPDGIPLEVQVGVIERLEDLAELRFVDTREEALDETEPTAPVHSDGVLLGLGSISEESPPTVRGERYRDESDVDAYRFTMSRESGEWTVAGEPEAVEPESLISGS